MKKVAIILTLFTLALFAMGVSLFPGCEMTKDGGVYRSENKGADFEEANQLGDKKSIATYNIHSMAIDPESPNILYAGSDNKGLFKSEDSGGRWTNILAKVDVESIAIDPNDPNRIYAVALSGSNARIFINSDGGFGPWEEIFIHTNQGEPITDIVIDPQNSSVLYVSAEEGALYKSADKGETWSFVGNVDEKTNALAVNQSKPNQMFMATNKGLFRSQDGGKNWGQLMLTGEEKETVDVNTVVVDPNSSQVVYAVTEDGIYKSTNEGNNWKLLETLVKPGDVEFVELAVDPSSSSTMYFSAGSAVHITVDGGFSWTPRLIPTTREISSIVIDPVDTQNIYIGLSREGTD